MQTVYLNGDIAKFGAVWQTNCRNIRDIFKLIECQTPGFRKYLIEATDADVSYEIKRGEEIIEGFDELFLSLKDEDIIVTEVPSGSKTGGAKLIGALILTASLLVDQSGTLGTILSTTIVGEMTVATVVASLAVSLALQGTAQLLAPGPEVDAAEENKGYLFSGAVNNVVQGMPVPLAYGELVVGGAPISVNYDTKPIKFGTYTNTQSDDGKIPFDYTAGNVVVPPVDYPPSDPGTESYPLPADPHVPDLDLTLPDDGAEFDPQ